AGLGYIDYLTGYEQTFLLFYLVPIGLGTWFGNFGIGLTVSVFSIITWVVSDIAAGVPSVGLWNVGMAFGSYGVFTTLLSKLRTRTRWFATSRKELILLEILHAVSFRRNWKPMDWTSRCMAWLPTSVSDLGFPAASTGMTLSMSVIRQPRRNSITSLRRQ